MYWKTEKVIFQDVEYITYNYFAIIERPIKSGPYYNPLTKMIVHPANKDLVIKAKAVKTEQEFEEFYNKNKEL